MPVYEYQGQHFDIDTDDRDEAKKRIISYLEKQGKSAKEQLGIATQAPEDAADFTRGIGNIVPQTKNVYYGAKALTGVVAKKMGYDETGNELIKSGLEGMKKAESNMIVKESDEFLNAWEKGIGTVITDWLPYQAGAGVGSLAETLGFMAVGAGVGAVGGAGVGAAPGAIAGAVSKSLVKQGIKEAAEKIVKEEGKEAAEKFIQNEAKKTLIKFGSTAGMGTMAGMHGLGEVGGRAIEEAQQRGLQPDDINLYKVLPAAAVHSVADFISSKIMLNALSPVESTGKSLALEIAKRIAITGGKELVPEEIQTIAERFGAELSLSDAEAIREYINTGAAAFGMSVVPGAAGAVRGRITGKLKEDAYAAKEESDKKQSADTLDKAATEASGTTDPAVLAKLQPAVGADGQPLAQVSQTTVDATNEVNQVIADGEKLKQEQEASAVQLATDYLAKIDGGEKIKQGDYRQVAKALGIKIPVGTKNADGVEMIRQHLATLGGQNVGTADTTAGGAGATVSGQQTGVSAPGATTTVGQGLGGTPPTTGTPTVGATNQQSPLAPTATNQAAPPPVATPGFTPSGPTPAPGFTSEQQLREAAEKDIAEQEAAAEQQRLAFEESKTKTIPPTRVAPEIIEEYEGTRQEMEDAIPAWEKLTPDEKDVYLENIRQNTIEEHRAAGRALADYRASKGRGAGYQGVKLGPGEQRVVNMYNQSRVAASRELGIDFPEFSDLSPEAQALYLQNVSVSTPAEQLVGFTAVAEQLETEGQGIRGAAQVDVEAARQAGFDEQAQAAAQERIERERAAAQEAVGKGMPLSEDIVQALREGDINYAITLLVSQAKGLKTVLRLRGDKTYDPLVAELADTRTKATKFIFQFIARRLSTIKLDSKVVMDPNNEVIQRLQREGKLAEYDPKTDTFYFTEQGLDEATLLHEAVHAATVKIINTYLTNPSALTAEQREAMEHLEKIFDFAKKKLGGKYKNAFENLFEFISYALTDNKFQIALSEVQSKPLTKYSFAGSLWNHLTQVFSKIYGLFTPSAKRLELANEVYDEVLKSYGSMDLDKAYEVLDDASGDEVVELVELIPGNPGEEPKTRRVTGPLEKGKQYEAQVKREKFKRDRRFITKEAGYEGNLLIEISEIFNRILEVPEAGTDVAPLAAKKAGAQAQPKQPKKAAQFRESGIMEDDPQYNVKADDMPKDYKYFAKLFFTAPGWRQLATKFQNSRYHIKHWQDQLDLANKIIDVNVNRINNIYTQLTLSASLGKNYYNQYVKDIDENLEMAVINFAKASGLDVTKALNRLFRIAEALHDGERRHEKYLMVVPLSENKVLNNGKLSPADRRVQIYELLDSNIKLSESQIQQLKQEMEALAKNYADPLGTSPRMIVNKDGTRKPLPIDENNELYNVTGLSPAARNKRLKEFDALPSDQKKFANEVFDNLQKMHKATTTLNKIGNYWSQPVSNRVSFYGFKNYIPLKGITAKTDADEMLDFDGQRMGRELQEMEHTFEGRTTVSQDPILQTRADAARAALRAGRKDLTQSIKNAINPDKNYNPMGQGLLNGKIIAHYTFAERRNIDPKALKGETKIFHYNEDGSIDVIQINDKQKLEAIRRTYKDTNSTVNIANKVTSFLGALHTRYNYNFAPMNFVRDALTNAFTLSAEMSPVEAAKYIKAIAARTLQGGMTKAVDVAVAYSSGNTAALQKMKSDPIARDMIEYIEAGGMVSYLQSLSIKSNFQELQKQLGRRGIVRKKEQLDQFVDIWTEMFELSSRSAAYAVVKKAKLAETAKDVKDGKMTQADAEKRATVRATAYAKNLANFEQVGDLGKTMGAFYMFFRPSATGAVRAIEAIAPAFRSMNKVVAGLPDTIKKDPEAMKAFKENYAGRQRNARITASVGFGIGMMAYYMAQMLADDDELGRNKVEADNMQSWTRFARFHIPKSLSGQDDFIIQVPWGFGLGAFAASGAQIAGAISGKGSFADALFNIATQISLDSFVPVPVSRMDIRENPLEFVLDSFMPSASRPILEFALNKNGLGQDIYSDKNRRMGDAYTGGDRVPAIYRDLSRELANITNGFIDWSPNSVYFLANSYLDGIAKVGELGYGLLDIAKDNKSFEPKTDIPFLGSFIGSKSNYDAREFSKVENQIKDMEKKLNMFKLDPEQYDKYVTKNPFAEILVALYNENVGGRLKDINTEINYYNRMKDLKDKDRKEIIKGLRLDQNIIKRQMIDDFKAYGVEP